MIFLLIIRFGIILFINIAKKGKLNGYLDGNLVKTLDVPSITATKFAMNFAGCISTAHSSIRNFKIILGTYALNSYLYSDIKFEDSLRIN